MEPYHAFLVRCWRERQVSVQEPPRWRFVLIEIGGASETAIGFANFDLLVAFLAREILSESQRDSGTAERRDDSMETE